MCLFIYLYMYTYVYISSNALSSYDHMPSLAYLREAGVAGGGRTGRKGGDAAPLQAHQGGEMTRSSR